MLPFIAIAQALSAISAVAGTYMSIQGQRSAAKAAEQSAEWNADQQRKQAAYEEGVAQRNMRKERENNKRELARRRANSARGGLMETGAVADNLIEASERHQVEIDEIWEKASTQAQTRRAQANMSIWEGKQSASAAKTNMWATGIGAVGSVANTAMKFGGGGDTDVWSQKSTPSTRNYTDVYGS